MTSDPPLTEQFIPWKAAVKSEAAAMAATSQTRA
jgi:hypothetical protein